ncbi:unnamed protein product [Rhodiola kirilowii]
MIAKLKEKFGILCPSDPAIEVADASNDEVQQSDSFTSDVSNEGVEGSLKPNNEDAMESNDKVKALDFYNSKVLYHVKGVDEGEQHFVASFGNVLVQEEEILRFKDLPQIHTR